ncbi:MAG: glycosyltransferase [Terriglobales bacterium]
MISLVVPTCNERANLEPMLRRSAAALSIAAAAFEIIIVDDASTDGTRDEVRRLQAGGFPWLRLIERDHEHDLSTAVLAGWRAARGDVLGCMDADLQHPPELLSALVLALRRQAADVAIASRYTPGASLGAWGKARRLGSRAATALASLILPGALAGVTDPMSGFFLVSRRAAALEALRPQGYKILLELLARAQPLQVTEVPFRFGTRTAGESKASWRVTWRFLRQIAALAAATGELRRMVNFGLVGLSGTAVNYAGFALLRHLTPSVAIDAAASAAIAICNNFLGNEFYTFRDAARLAPAWRDRAARFARFYALSLAGLGINTAVVLALTGLLAWPLALAAGITSAVSWNFFSNSTLTWRRTPQTARARAA